MPHLPRGAAREGLPSTFVLADQFNLVRCSARQACHRSADVVGATPTTSDRRGIHVLGSCGDRQGLVFERMFNDQLLLATKIRCFYFKRDPLLDRGEDAFLLARFSGVFDDILGLDALALGERL